MMPANQRIQALVWMLPMPEWPALTLGRLPSRQSYIVSNQSDNPIQIEHVALTLAEDARVAIVGGSCHAGLLLAPQETCSIEVQVSPAVLGPVRQVLELSYVGHADPLWTEISTRVVSTPDKKTKGATYLVTDTSKMARQRRLLEQDGHRRYARVEAREHPEARAEDALSASAEGGLQNNILQNPWLNSQRFDGIDSNLNPEPPLNTDAQREYDNERRDQEMEKQLRLGNMPRVSSAPKPQGM